MRQWDVDDKDERVMLTIKMREDVDDQDERERDVNDKDERERCSR